MTQGIYSILNKINNKIYIGSSLNIENRWNQHLRALNNDDHKSKHLQNSFNRYGIENFEFKILEIVQDINELLTKEQKYIDNYKSYEREFGYNTIKNVLVGGRLGVPHSEETKEKISNFFKGRKISEEHRQKIIAARTGTELSDNTKRKIGEKNRKFSDKDIPELINLYENGKSYSQIAKVLGCSKTVVHEFFLQLFEQGVIKKRSEVIREEVVYLLENTDLKQKEIARKLNISESNVTVIKKEWVNNGI
ncbi:GIY-YIG nuclease family protein [Ureibacillus chungkukjangi]|uniref:GIY-YIG nuclease family protein n=1 Tax=Ureibacillus chungkukjangi TaxID=1202712 RepID=UPI00203AE2FA|nr:GIY-YIG nuclease family protein [Ureibacillus chungkukjangi]MCM3387258.1 GIY-YIG nuclease family protein [Ureibacillus chungkukjangi]